jgi:hypothetical protein
MGVQCTSKYLRIKPFKKNTKEKESSIRVTLKQIGGYEKKWRVKQGTNYLVECVCSG